jgi:DNA (cytosine-5)-methyltransferase 1
MRIGSLFTGTGALDLAAQAVFGGEVVWHSDIKPAAVTFLEHRYPATPNIGDITLIDPRDVAPIDLLTFGWPCQPHSSAGKRLGEKDPRALFPEVLRLARHLRPRILLGENVARVISNGELRRVARTLAEIGYVGAWRCLTAGEVGAPHKRDRLFLVAVREDVEPPDLGPVRVAGAPSRLTLLKTPTANLGSNGGTQHPDKRKAGGHGPTLADEVEWLLPTPSASSYGTNQGGAAGRVGPVRESLNTMARNERFAADRWGRYSQAIARWEPIIGRPAPEPTAPSPVAGRKPVLAPAFVEWMMGLPAGWVTDVPGLARTQQLSMLGDGVVPQQAIAAYRGLFAELTQGERAA